MVFASLDAIHCKKMNSFFKGGEGKKELWLTLSKSEVAVCPGSQQASECQAEQGKDDSQEANPLKLFGRQSLNFHIIFLCIRLMI